MGTGWGRKEKTNDAFHLGVNYLARSCHAMPLSTWICIPEYDMPSSISQHQRTTYQRMGFFSKLLYLKKIVILESEVFSFPRWVSKILFISYPFFSVSNIFKSRIYRQLLLCIDYFHMENFILHWWAFLRSNLRHMGEALEVSPSPALTSHLSCYLLKLSLFYFIIFLIIDI